MADRAGDDDLVPWVDGRTRLFGIIGDPIEQVRSPERVTTLFQRRGINAILLPMHVRPDRFDETVAGAQKGIVEAKAAMGKRPARGYGGAKK